MSGNLDIGKQLPKPGFPKNPVLPQPKFNLNNPNSFNGAPRNSVEKWLFENGWKRSGETNTGGGIRFTNGRHGEQIRIMPGYPPGLRPDILKTGPYLEISIKGKKHYIPLNGNPTL